MKIYWYWPHPHRAASPLALSTLRPGDALTVQALASLRGERLGPVAEYEVVRTLPDPTLSGSTRLARLLRKPRLAVERSVARRSLLARGFDVAHLAMLSYQTDWLDVPRLRRGRSLISTVHDVRPHRSAMPRPAEYALLRRLYRQAGDLIVYHEVLADELVSDFGVDRDLIHVVPHPLDSTDRRLPISQDDEHPMVLLFGSLRPNKGIEVLLDAVEANPDVFDAVRVVIAGTGHLSLEQRIRARTSRCPGVEFESGFVTPERKRELFSLADAVVLPYTQFHSQSGVLADAYAYRVPLVVTDVGALGASVRSDGTGVVVQPGSASDLAAGVEAVLNSDPDAWRSAVELAAQRHDYSVVGPQLRHAYEVTASRAGAF